MKKCGIITYHFAANNGAQLQCFALNRTLTDLKTDAYVLNFISPKQKTNNAMYKWNRGIKGIVKSIMLLPFHSTRKKRIDSANEFRDKYMRCTREVNTIDALQELVNNENFDVIISGSDQVFNPFINDFEKAFLFPFDTKAKKVGYAVSMGKATVKDLEPYKGYISQFARITVREKSAVPILRDFSGVDVVDVYDPVFLLSGEKWNELADAHVSEDKYLLCYFIRNLDLDRKLEIAKKIAADKGLKLIILSGRVSKYVLKEKVILDANPIDFISWIKNASFVCTDSFHGTAFSTLFNRDFVTLEKQLISTDNRKADLLKDLGLEDRIHALDEESIDTRSIDYTPVNRRIETVRDYSVGVLTDLIS